MIVRAIDSNGDWTFGKGLNDYKSGTDAVAQSIQTRLLSFLGDCFFATQDGIDWFNLLGNKNEMALNLAIATIIKNTDNVAKISQVSISLDAQRVFSCNYTATTAFGVVAAQVEFNPVQFLTTEDGFTITTEDGDPIIVG